MAIYSGSSKFDEKDPSLRLAQLIAGFISERQIISVLKDVGPKIGEIAFMTDPVKPGQAGDIMSESDLPAGFDGWIYANGCRIAKHMFPEAFKLFKDIGMEYFDPGEAQTAWVRIPTVDKFFKLDTSADKSQAFKRNGSVYSMPEHGHRLGGSSPSGASMTQTIKRCAYIWATSVTTPGGHMPEVHGITVFNKYIDYIPAAPSAHGTDKCGNVTYRKWDIPIDTFYNEGEKQLICDTGVTGVNVSSCEPRHLSVPVRIYIGGIL